MPGELSLYSSNVPVYLTEEPSITGTLPTTGTIKGDKSFKSLDSILRLPETFSCRKEPEMNRHQVVHIVIEDLCALNLPWYSPSKCTVWKFHEPLRDQE